MHQTGPDYLEQTAFDFGDPMPCCACPLGRGPTATTCRCQCHDLYRQFFALEPKVNLGPSVWPAPVKTLRPSRRRR